MLLNVASVNLSPGESDRINKVARELDTAIEEFFADARPLLSCEQWGLLTIYATACVRRALEVGVMLHGLVDNHGSRHRPYPGRGRDVFVKASLAAWRDAFAPIPDVWRLAPISEAVPGGEQRVHADVETLEVMAANRMFVSLDDQSAAFLSPTE
jgi:hypothetical protein